jgi:hypothetical protein
MAQVEPPKAFPVPVLVVEGDQEAALAVTKSFLVLRVAFMVVAVGFKEILVLRMPVRLVAAQFVSSGPVRLVNSRQQTPVTFNHERLGR